MRSGDDFLYGKAKFNNGPWTTWVRVGKDFTLTSDPIAFADPATNKTYIFARGFDNAIYVFDTLGDNSWTRLGGDFSG